MSIAPRSLISLAWLEGFRLHSASMSMLMLEMFPINDGEVWVHRGKVRPARGAKGERTPVRFIASTGAKYSFLRREKAKQAARLARVEARLASKSTRSLRNMMQKEMGV